MKRCCLGGIAFLILLSILSVCTARPLRAATCSAAEFHQLDFFIGNWIVKDRSGHIVANDSVSSEYGGCVLIERWSGAGDSGQGIAILGYDPAQASWHVDSFVHGGDVLAFDGQKTGDTMVLTGTEYPKSGPTRLHRLTWSVQRDGSIEQLWQTSTDAGKSWQVYFDGIYERISE